MKKTKHVQDEQQKQAERGTNYNSVLIGVSEFIINVHGRRLRRALSSLKYIFKFRG